MTAPVDPARLTTAAKAVGPDKPQLAATLASSGLSHGEINAVGGFAQALQVDTTLNLAADSGANVNLTATEQNRGAAIGANVPQPSTDSRSWLEKAVGTVSNWVGDTSNFLFSNPVTHAIEDAGNWLGNAAHLPFRLLSSGLDSSNDAEINQEMRADGYNPDSATSYLNFMFSQGENVYHNLDKVRNTYDGNQLSDGRTMTDLVIQAQRDPAQFQSDFEKMPPDQAAELQKMMQSDDWQKAYAAVDAEHISPGRDIARIVTLGHTDNEAFHLLSGALDAAYDWYSDPTLILGKASKAIQAMDALGRDASAFGKLVAATPGLRGMRAGLADATDQAGVEALLKVGEDGKPLTQVGRGWQAFLDDASALRKQHAIAQDTTLTAEERATAAAQRAGIYRAMANRYGSLMGLLDEVNGTRVVSELAKTGGKIDALAETAGAGGHIVENGQPIEDLDQLSKHLTSTNGLLRLSGGIAARRDVIMPGRLSAIGEKIGDLQAARTASKTAKKAMWDYSKPDQILPIAEEVHAQLPDTPAVGPDGQALSTSQAGDAQFAALRKSALVSIKSARAKADRLSRRITTLVPNVTHIDLTDSNSSKLVEQLGRTYLNKGDAARLASRYALSDLAGRRQVVKGLIDQLHHASGLSKSADGQDYMAKFLGDFDREGGTQKYGFDTTSEMRSGEDGPVRQVALYPDQLSTHVLIPEFRQMKYLAAKYAVGGFARRTGLASLRAFGQGSAADKLMAAVKIGWIATAAGGLRNAADEIANFAVYGMGKDVAAGRVAFTKATQKLRAARRSSSSDYLGLLKTGLDGGGPVSRGLLNEQLGLRAGEQGESYRDAAAVLKRATDAQAKVDNLPAQLQRNVDAAAEFHGMAVDQNKQALQALEDGKAAGLPEDQLAALRDRAQSTADARARAKQALAQHEKRLANPDDELAKLQRQHADRGIPSVTDAQAKVTAAKAELEKTMRLQSAIKYRIPLGLRYAADTVNDLMVAGALGKMLSVFGKIDLSPDSAMVKHASELVDSELTQTLREGVFQSHYADEGAYLGSDDYAMDLHRNGLQARRYGYQQTAKYQGWGEVEADGGTGLDAMAKTLQLRFADRSSPAHSWIQTLLPQMDEKGNFTHEALGEATAAVRRRLEEDDPAYDSIRHFVNNAEVFQQTKAGVAVGNSKVLLDQAKDEYAERVSADLLHALAARTGDGTDAAAHAGRINRGLAEQLFDSYQLGEVPDRSWLANNLPQSERPKTAIGQLWAPYNAAHEPGTFPRGYTQMMTKAYDKVVTDQIDALSRNPLVAALYHNARTNTQGYVDHLVDAGWSEDAADEVAKRISLRHAQDEAFKHIDNPYVASQFSLINRNYFAFVRAQEDWLRRWGNTLKDNPELIRKTQLLIHGGQSAGLVEQDDQGQLTFVYPGSSLALGLFGKLFGIHGETNAAGVPISGELSSQLQLLNPSLDNPIGLTATPLLSLPFKAISKFVGPNHAMLMSSLDTALNGQMGAGRTWYQQLLPSWANRIMGGVLSTDPASKYGAAYTQALANMEAAGQLDDPALQTPSGKARFQQALQASIHNNMMATALFGMFAPAAPTLNPESVVGGSHNAAGIANEGAAGHGNEADWSAHIMGINSLRSEARKVFSDLPYEQALAWWQKVHPGELIYAQTGASARTQVETKDASAPATIGAAEWMQHNEPFLQQYGGKGGVATYFMPQGTGQDGTYSDVAYRAQLEAGIRTYKTLDDYFDDIVTQRGEKAYFDAKDQYDQERSAAVASGDKSQVQALDSQWSATKNEIYAGNPLLAAKFAGFATSNSASANQIAQLTAMANDTSPATAKALGASRPGLVQLLQAYEQYQQGYDAIAGLNSKAANNQRQLLRDTYTATVQQIAGGASAQYPELADLARGVFRLPS